MTTLYRNLFAMPTTPQPTNHSDNTERKEFTITSSPHPEANSGDEPTNTPYRDEDGHCPCGALAEGNGPCRKCRARATWNRRQANRGRRYVRPSSRPASSRREGRGSNQLRGRRPGH